MSHPLTLPHVSPGHRSPDDGLVREGGVLSLLATQLALADLDLELLLAGQAGLVTLVVIRLQTQHPGQGRGDHPGDVHSPWNSLWLRQELKKLQGAFFDFDQHSDRDFFKQYERIIVRVQLEPLQTDWQEQESLISFISTLEFTCPLEEDAGVVSVFAERVLEEGDREVGGDNLWHELGEDDHEDAGQEPGLQEHGAEPVGDREQEVIPGLRVDGGQLGREEDDENDEHLATHEELLHVVWLGSHLAQLEGMGMGVAISFRILPLQLNQGDLLWEFKYDLISFIQESKNLKTLHEPEPK